MTARLVAEDEQGFSLIEMLIALCLTAILAAMAVVQIGAARPLMQADGAMRAIMGNINAARETAVAQRREIELIFVGTNVLRIMRHELPIGSTPTLLREITLEGGMEFRLVSPSSDTPDAFGNGAPVSFGSATTYQFNGDGMLVDSGGSVINGTVFLAQPNANQTFRAVTVLGSTGRVRGFKWTGSGWTQV